MRGCGMRGRIRGYPARSDSGIARASWCRLGNTPGGVLAFSQCSPAMPRNVDGYGCTIVCIYLGGSTNRMCAGYVGQSVTR